MNKKIFINCKKADDWQNLLVNKDLQWKTGYSAKTLAHSWQESFEFPDEIIRVFEKSEFNLFRNIELLIAIPEYEVKLKGKGQSSKSDIFLLTKSENNLVTIIIEGKVSENFGEKVSKWLENSSDNKKERLDFILEKLDLKNKNIDDIEYQFLHRTASAIITAQKFCTKKTMVLFHSFSKDNKNFEKYSDFLNLFNIKAEINKIHKIENKINEIDLYCSWIKGNEKYLHII